MTKKEQKDFIDKVLSNLTIHGDERISLIKKEVQSRVKTFLKWELLKIDMYEHREKHFINYLYLFDNPVMLFHATRTPSSEGFYIICDFDTEQHENIYAEECAIEPCFFIEYLFFLSACILKYSENIYFTKKIETYSLESGGYEINSVIDFGFDFKEMTYFKNENEFIIQF